MQEQSLSGGSTTNPMVVRFKCTDMECSRQENRISRFIFILMVFAVFTLFIPGVNAGVPGDNPHISAIPSIQELNVTNASFANRTIPEKYKITPTLIDLNVKITETLLPAPKGEMAAGPRFIGFSTTPETLAVVIVAVAAGIAGCGMQSDENGENDTRVCFFDGKTGIAGICFHQNPIVKSRSLTSV